MFALLAYTGKHFLLMTVAVFVENFCSGLSTAALLAFMMSLCNHRFTATQFALLSAVSSLARVFLGPIAALMVENAGWIQFFVWSFVLCFPGILLLTLLKQEVMCHEHATAD
jgi:PAT family beta-lactamase induction signal transducer AmpG